MQDIVRQRLLDRTDRSGDCWLWTGAIVKGYGTIKVARRMRPVHRLAYEIFVGPVVDELDVDHICHNLDQKCEGGFSCLHRRCLKPTHLRLTSRSENILGGRGPERFRALNAGKTHCPQGHPYNEENTYWRPDGKGRGCLICRRWIPVHGGA